MNLHKLLFSSQILSTCGLNYVHNQVTIVTVLIVNSDIIKNTHCAALPVYVDDMPIINISFLHRLICFPCAYAQRKNVHLQDIKKESSGINDTIRRGVSENFYLEYSRHQKDVPSRDFSIVHVFYQYLKKKDAAAACSIGLVKTFLSHY